MHTKMDSLSDRTLYIFVLSSFILLFFILLLPIAQSNSIIGSIDTLIGMGLSNLYINRIDSVLTGMEIGEPMYPANISGYGETSLGGASIYILFKLLGFTDVYSIYLTQVCLLGFLGFSMFLFARYYTRYAITAFFASIVFVLSSFLWANIDDLLIHLYVFPLISLLFLQRSISGTENPSGN